MNDKSHANLYRDNVINIQRISPFRKQDNNDENQSETLPNYFLGISLKKKGV